MQNNKTRTWAEISMNALENNLKTIRGAIAPTCKIMGIVKANAYGHGAVQISKQLEALGCDYLAVATLLEAEQLREANISLPILILSHTPVELLSRVLEADCAQALGSPDDAHDYSREMCSLGKTLRVHIKLDTGMSRTGFYIADGKADKLLSALSLPGFDAEGVFTHLAVADEPDQRDFTLRQFELFRSVVAKAETASGKMFAVKHCANSAGVLNYPQLHLDMVRAGISLYGVSPGENCRMTGARPVMSLKTHIIQISHLHAGDTVSYGRRFTADRDMTVAVLPIGYADGLHRVLSGKIDVLIHGKRCRQLGTICMDLCMVDVSDCEGAVLHDTALIFGHDGDAFISAEELAEKAGTIGYEILTSVSSRIPRIYVD